MNRTPATSFMLVAAMNTAFGNPKGDPQNIDWARVRSQSKNIGHEFCELMSALGADPGTLTEITKLIDNMEFASLEHTTPNRDDARDALCDVQVFACGAQHFMGIDGDRDMLAVVNGVMTRFVKDEADLEATKAIHAAKGVTVTYTEGDFPNMILKSGEDQPDAPRGKFLKSASYEPTKFYDPAYDE